MKELQRELVGNSEIVKIIPSGDNVYDVYFNFLSLPVKMNKQFLDTITKAHKSNKIN